MESHSPSPSKQNTICPFVNVSMILSDMSGEFLTFAKPFLSATIPNCPKIVWQKVVIKKSQKVVSFSRVVFLYDEMVINIIYLRCVGGCKQFASS